MMDDRPLLYLYEEGWEQLEVDLASSSEWTLRLDPRIDFFQ